MSLPDIAVPASLERLLAPISAENPCGESLRYEGTYDRVEQARREDDASLPQGKWEAELKRADWRAVETICTEALESRSKDLQLAAWLLQAWIHLDGFAGAARGFELMHGLCENFWDGLFPQITEGDVEFRLAPIYWVNEKLPLDFKLTPLTRPLSDDTPTCCLADWESSLRATVSDKKSSDFLAAQIQNSLQRTPREWFVGLKRDVEVTLHQRDLFDQLLDAKIGKLSPGTSQIRVVVESVAQLLDSILTHALPELSTAMVATEEELSKVSADHNTGLSLVTSDVQTTAIRTRAEAYRLLEQAADFLQRTEPHSPTPYLLRRAVSWGRMSFDQLLPELVRSNSELSEIVRLLQAEVSKNPKP